MRGDQRRGEETRKEQRRSEETRKKERPYETRIYYESRPNEKGERRPEEEKCTYGGEKTR